SWNRFTYIDPNGDAYAEWNAQWNYDDAYYCAFYYGPDEHPADDWLVCPPMQFDPNKLYRLSFNWYAYYGYGSEFEIAVGSEATAENLSLGVIEKISAVSSFSDMPGRKVSIDFAVAPGDRFVAFHNITVNMEHLSIDNITIEECGDSRVPARVGNPVGKRLSKSSIGLSFEMPSYTAAGLRITAPMSARIYRAIDFKLLAEFTDVKPGAALEWTDNSPIEGINTYIVVAVNEIGEGLETEITVDMSDAIPVPLTNVVATYVSGSQIDITWDPYTSTVGANGNPTDPAEVRYMVYKPVTKINDDGDYVTSYNMIARDLSEPRFTDYAPLEGLDASLQQMLTYYVCAVNGAGEGEATESTGVIIGPAFTLPFAETWHNQTVATNPWFKGNDNGANWYVKHQGYEPMAPGQDGYGLITCEVSTFGGVKSEGSAAMFTPRIDLTSMTAPKLSFWMWTSPDYDSDIYLQVGMDVEGKGNGIFATKYYARADKAEWRHITVDLAAVADASRASV
ncbi:MAG: hypothetical protein K2M97_07080, partial [Muribaculaceae bacterium]|nr:hypothetical protein [Muribaculaceae bacterium]